MQKITSLIAIPAFLAWSTLALAAEEELAPALAEQMANPVATLTTIGKVIGGFFVVAGLMALAFKLIQRLGLGNSSGQGGRINILETRSLGPKKYISLVEVGGQQLAVGITEQQISLLCQLDQKNNGQAAQQPGSEQASFAATLAEAGHESDQEQSHV